MTTKHDPELEQFKRSIDLVEYAKKAGYEPRPREVGPGLTVLDHPNRDRIVVAQSPSGPWIYASVADYRLRAPTESTEQAFARLRDCIDRAKDRGSIVEFVQNRDWTARPGEVPLERVRERLRGFCATGLVLDFEGALRPPNDGPERSTVPPRDGRRADGQAVPGEGAARTVNPELHRRRYTWTPPANAPIETEVDQRLRRWREAQGSIDQRLQGPREAGGRDPQPAPAPALERAASGPLGPGGPPTDRSSHLGQNHKPALGQRRYDWTPAPAGVDAIARGSRSRSPDRDR